MGNVKQIRSGASLSGLNGGGWNLRRGVPSTHSGMKREPRVRFLDEHGTGYKAARNLSYMWSFGSLAGLCLIVQIRSGLFLAMHYRSHIDLAFGSVERIMREVSGGWLLRYVHRNGASMFFMVVYRHVLRGLRYWSFRAPREAVWLTGVVLLLLLIITAFLGYVLPWGQMSFWGATVITSLAGAIPVVGGDLVGWLWGGFSVGNSTLNRFFGLHFVLPFIMAGLSTRHILRLHQYGSSNPKGTDVHRTPWLVSLFPGYWSKDLVAWCVFGVWFGGWVFFSPNTLGHPDNYIPANPMVTPAHIVPEWYFLWVYAILRRIPSKLGGVRAVALALLSLRLLPAMRGTNVRVSPYTKTGKVVFWVMARNLMFLSYLGGKPVEDPYIGLGLWATRVYFMYFVAIIGLRLTEEAFGVQSVTALPSSKLQVRLVPCLLSSVHLSVHLFGCYRRSVAQENKKGKTKKARLRL